MEFYADFGKWRLGMQEIFLGSQRLFLSNTWDNLARVWAGAKYFSKGKNLDSYLVLAKIADPSRKQLYGDRYVAVSFNTWRFNQSGFLDFYFFKGLSIGKGLSGENLDLNTIGIRAMLKGKKLSFEFEPVYQFGKNGPQKQLSFGYAGVLAYSFSPDFKLNCQHYYASGDNDPNDSVYRTFDRLYGSVHGILGIADYQGWKNLKSFQFGTEFNLTKNLKLQSDYLYFNLDQSKDAWYADDGTQILKDATGKSGTEVGREFDLLLSWKLSEDTNISAGYAHFLPGEFARKGGITKPSDWYYLQTEIKNKGFLH